MLRNTNHPGPAIMLVSALLLSACSTQTTAFQDDYVPAAHYERYPIDVAKVPVTMGINARSSTLTPAQANAAMNFAEDARNNAQSKISIRWPSGGANSRRGAQEIAEIFVRNQSTNPLIRAKEHP